MSYTYFEHSIDMDYRDRNISSSFSKILVHIIVQGHCNDISRARAYNFNATVNSDIGVKSLNYISFLLR